jgi:hypothetical protein
MGKQTNIKLRGTVENTIYYQWKGIHCIRTAPARVRQTAPTKKAAANFGIAVRTSAVVRSLFRKLLPETASRSVIYKTDAVFRKWLQTNPLDKEPVNDIEFFDGFSFNDAANLKKILKKEVSAERSEDGSLLLKLPALNPVEDIDAPAGTCQVVLQVIAATVDMKKPGMHCSTGANIVIQYNDTPLPAQEILFANATKAGCIALVATGIRFYKDNIQSRPVNIMRWKPVAIIAGFYN